MEGTIFQKMNRRPIEVEEAVQRVKEYGEKLKRKIEWVPIHKAFGRILGDHVKTNDFIPHFRRSGYDGYAIQSSDVKEASLEHPALLKVVDYIPCGNTPNVILQTKEAARIMTGAMVPNEADSVIMLEAVKEEKREGATYISVRKPVEANRNVTPIGFEKREGETVLHKGMKINAGEMAVLASLGYERVPVFRKPKAAILSTGTELLDVNEPLVEGKIRNSNSYMLAAQIEQCGGIAEILPKLQDKEGEVKDFILSLCQRSDLDFIITTGGVSVGDYDIIADFFLDWEGTTLFNKVKMRPGSVTTVGFWKDKMLFGLSGNPSACYVGFELFVRPSIYHLLHIESAPNITTAILEEDYKKKSDYPRFVRGRFTLKNGNVFVSTTGLDKSSALLSMVHSNCLIIIPENSKGLSKGSFVDILIS